MSYSVHFEPLLGTAPLVLAALAAFALLAFMFFGGRRGAALRLLACGFFALALLNPVLWREERTLLPAVIALVADNSQSQNFGARRQDTEQALAQLQQNLAKMPLVETRIIRTGRQDNAAGNAPLETRLFAPLRDALADVPPGRIGGAILLTDGQAADIPALPPAAPAAAAIAKLGFAAPVNALITGSPQEYDRVIRFVKAPRFGIAGKIVPLSFIVQDEGALPAAANAPITAELFVNGEKQGQYTVRSGAETELNIRLPLSRSNIIELRAPPLPGEVTDMNNHAAIIIDGVRENLKVLLVSGEPHNGLRAWRDLLKSDTGVDLLHFTILRPPEKQDNTPIRQLSLIVFPTTELFVNRLRDFDLVIFDRYQHYDVLPLIYYEYMARYVENGGALLMAAGPEFAGGASLALTPLARILPARPTGNIFEKPFLPRLTAAGKRHPVTQNLEGADANPPKWGAWLRQIEAETDKDSLALMQGADNAPLMVLAEKGKGRVGMLLSDEGWLWARGFQGGGPYAALYRRMAHWLMKEPELESERLTATAQGHKILIARHTLGAPAAGGAPAAEIGGKTAKARPRSRKSPPAKPSPIAPFHITLPSGKTMDIAAQPQPNGLYEAEFTSPESGLVRIANGDKSTLVHAGAPNQPEYRDIISTPAKLAPLAAATGGHVLRLHKKTGDAVNIGSIKFAAAGESAAAAANPASLILQKSSDSRLIAQEHWPLFAQIWALPLGLMLLALSWWREGRP